MPEILEGETKLPGGKKVPKKYLIAAGGVAAAYVGYRWFTRTPAVAVEGGAIDPATADATMPVGGGGSAVAGGSDGAYGDSTIDASVAPPTNATWSQESQRLLEGVGFDSMFAATALGAYLSNQALTSTQAAAIQTAWAMNGHPPSGAFSIHLSVAPDPVTEEHAGEVVKPAPAPATPTPATPTPAPPAAPVKLPGSIAPTKAAGTAFDTTTANETLAAFQARIFSKRGYMPTYTSLVKLNPGQGPLLLKMKDEAKPKHSAVTLQVN